MVRGPGEGGGMEVHCAYGKQFHQFGGYDRSHEGPLVKPVEVDL